MKRRRVDMCPCLHLPPVEVAAHYSTCPVVAIARRPTRMHCWFDWQARMQDPLTLHSCSRSQLGQRQAITPDMTRDMFQAQRARLELNNSSTSGTSSLLTQGYARIDRFMKVVNFARSNVDDCKKVYQVTDDLIRHYFAQCLRIIVGETCYIAHGAALHRYSGTTPVPQQSYAMTARQAGKTTNCALFLAALLCVADGGCLFLLYATNQAQASLVLKALKKIYYALPMGLRPAKITKENDHVFGVTSEYDGTEAYIQACSSNVDSVRGQTAKGVMCDEYMMIEQTFFDLHIRALMTVTNRVLLCVSTPGAAGSYMMRQSIKMRDHPADFPFSVFKNFSLVCDAHRHDSLPLSCRCRMDMLPPWRTLPVMRQMQAEYGQQGSAAYLREIMGEPVNSGDGIFDPKCLAETFAAPGWSCERFKPAGNVIYIAMDPANGGANEMAIVSFCWTEDARLVILGLDSFSTKATDVPNIRELILAHVRQLRALYPAWSHPASLIPLVEGNNNQIMANTCATVVLQECRPSRSLVGYNVDVHWKSKGVWTTDVMKEIMIREVDELLHEGRLLLCDQLYTTGRRSVDHQTPSSGGNGMRDILHEQLRNFHVDLKKRITGKISMQDNDDLGMAMCIGVYWSKACRREHSDLVRPVAHALSTNAYYRL